MDTRELKEAQKLLDYAIQLSVENDVIQETRYPGAGWYITWNEGSSNVKVKLTSEQKQLIFNRMIEDLEREQKECEDRLIKFIT